MRPDNQHDVPGRPNGTTPAQREAASDIARQQVEQAYTAPVGHNSTEQLAETYRRTHEPAHTVNEVDWSQYHSAWQNYYQQYYERYYTHYLHQTHQQIAQQGAVSPQQQPESQPHNEQISKDVAIQEIRQKLRDTVATRAKAIRSSRHFGPLVAAAIVMLVFGFIQYNQLILGTVHAYVQPGNIEPRDIIVDPTLSTEADPKSRRLVIPKINVDAPIDFNAKPDYDSQMASMKNGLAYFGVPGANSKPGQAGVTAIAGHSSSDAFSTSTYKFIFAQIHKLEKGDTMYVTYEGTRYTYVVTNKRKVLPTNVQSLVKDTDKPMITLITCTPIGRSTHRLLVDAEQVNPSPAGAKKAPVTSGNDTVEDIPGVEPNLFGRLFGQ